MRITFVANRDLHSNIALNMLLCFRAEHELTILLSEKVGVPSKDYQVPPELLELKHFEQGLFNTVISPLAEQQATTAQRYLTFREMGELIGRSTQLCNNINSSEGLAALEQSRPDLVVSIRYGSILRDPAIAIPRLGVLNLHSGLLPRFKGILTTLHSLVEGETEVGCTLHRIDSASIDAGPIIDMVKVPVDTTKSLLWHVFQLYPLGCEMIVAAIRELAAGKTLTSSTQNNAGQPYYSLPTAKKFSDLIRAGFRLWDAEDVSLAYGRYLTDVTRKVSWHDS